MSELRRIYWTQRFVAEEPRLSRTHLVPEEKCVALCGCSLPRGLGAQGTMQWDDTDNPEHLCQRCKKIADKESRNGSSKL